MAKLYQGGGKLVVGDVTAAKLPEFDVCVLFLVAMFLPVAKRGGFIRDLVEKKREGGAIVIVDKESRNNGYMDTVMKRLTLACKLKNGTAKEDVLAKEMSLAGIQRPVSRKEIPLNAIEWFRFGEFTGWVIE
jgi:tRNA (cmo5U34)-methyltransferase